MAPPAHIDSLNSQRDPAWIWRQRAIPVVFDDRDHGQLLVKLPYDATNRVWLRGGEHRKPEWMPAQKCWRVPRAWLEALVYRLGLRYGQVYMIHPYRTRETCAPACWNAIGVECECSCMGAHHGSGTQGDRWYVVSDTCAITWSARKYACRLLRARERLLGSPEM